MGLIHSFYLAKKTCYSYKIDEYSAVTLFVQEAERIQAQFKLTEHNYADVGRIVRLCGRRRR